MCSLRLGIEENKNAWNPERSLSFQMFVVSIRDLYTHAFCCETLEINETSANVHNADCSLLMFIIEVEHIFAVLFYCS